MLVRIVRVFMSDMNILLSFKKILQYFTNSSQAQLQIYIQERWYNFNTLNISIPIFDYLLFIRYIIKTKKG